MLNPLNLAVGQKYTLNTDYSIYFQDIDEKYDLVGAEVEILEVQKTLAEGYATDDNEPTYDWTVGVVKMKKTSTGEILDIITDFSEDYWAFFTSETPSVVVA